jgi:site-specific DNA recombinase
MKKAILYVRVSTDEQADRGYSLGVQQEQLEKYCALKDIEILKLYIEDHSAKNFERPTFRELLNYCKVNHRNIDYLLFVSWDRFSRNAPDAYEMIRKLNNWNIEPQAIIQPIDFSVPQNKVMLSIYLTLPEVDNDIRSQKVKAGMRGANKLGRWVRNAPYGYLNRRDEQNKPIIVPAPNAHLIEYAFKEVAKDERTLTEIRLEINRQGMKISRSNFSIMLRNPIYIGKIRIPETADELELIVQGIHEPLVSESLFNSVQNVLCKRVKKQNQPKFTKVHEELPLRGLLNCSNCGKHITGSASKSRTGDLHYYYHCMHCKKERFRADTANTEMEELLKAIQLTGNVDTLFKEILSEELGEHSTDRAKQKELLTKELNRLKAQKENLQNSFLDGGLSTSDYTELKKRVEERITDVKVQLNDLTERKNGFQEQLQQQFKILPNLVEWYRNSTVQEKKKLIGSIFPERFKFVKNEVRTTKINEMVALILRYTGRFKEIKKGQTSYYTHLSRLVTSSGFKPETS